MACCSSTGDASATERRRRLSVAPAPERSRHAGIRAIICAMDHCEIAVRVQPRARANEIVGERDGMLVVRVTAAPAGGQANDAVRRLVAKHARVGVRRVSIVRGLTAREKLIRVQGIGERELRRALAGGP